MTEPTFRHTHSRLLADDEVTVVVSRSFTVSVSAAECLQRLEAMSDTYARQNRDEVDALNFQIDWIRNNA